MKSKSRNTVAQRIRAAACSLDRSQIAKYGRKLSHLEHGAEHYLFFAQHYPDARENRSVPSGCIILCEAIMHAVLNRDATAIRGLAKFLETRDQHAEDVLKRSIIALADVSKRLPEPVSVTAKSFVESVNGRADESTIRRARLIAKEEGFQFSPERNSKRKKKS